MEQRGGNFRQRTRGMTLYVTMAAAFVIIGAVTAMGLFFKITEISVNGNQRYTGEEIIRASGIELDNSIFFMSRSGAEVRIKQELPYIDSVRVVRELPGTVVINITESQSSACVQGGGSWWVMDSTGRLLEKSAVLPSTGVIEIRGVTALEPELGKKLDLGNNETVRQQCLFDTLKAILDNNLGDKTAWLDLSNLSAVTFEYNGYRVNVGRADDLDIKFSGLMQFLANHTEAGTGSITYDDRNVLTYR